MAMDLKGVSTMRTNGWNEANRQEKIIHTKPHKVSCYAQVARPRYDKVESNIFYPTEMLLPAMYYIRGK